jgi:hypothetical protein
MNISFSPQRRDNGSLTLSKQGDILTIAGTACDFSKLPDGATLPGSAVNCPWLTGDVERINGELHLTLILPHGPNAPEATRFPKPIINPPDGVIELPLYNAEQGK